MNFINSFKNISKVRQGLDWCLNTANTNNVFASLRQKGQYIIDDMHSKAATIDALLQTLIPSADVIDGDVVDNTLISTSKYISIDQESADEIVYNFSQLTTDSILSENGELSLTDANGYTYSIYLQDNCIYYLSNNQAHALIDGINLRYYSAIQDITGTVTRPFVMVLTELQKSNTLNKNLRNVLSAAINQRESQLVTAINDIKIEASDFGDQLQESWNKGGFLSVVQFIVSTFNTTPNSTDNVTFSFTDNNQLVPTIFTAGIISGICTTVTMVLTGVAMAITNVYGAIALLLSAAFTGLISSISSVKDQSKGSINYDANLSAGPYAFDQCTINFSYARRKGQTAGNKGLLRAVELLQQGSTPLSVSVPGGILLMWKINENLMQYEFHPSIDDNHYVLARLFNYLCSIDPIDHDYFHLYSTSSLPSPGVVFDSVLRLKTRTLNPTRKKDLINYLGTWFSEAGDNPLGYEITYNDDGSLTDAGLNVIFNNIYANYCIWYFVNMALAISSDNDVSTEEYWQIPNANDNLTGFKVGVTKYNPIYFNLPTGGSLTQTSFNPLSWFLRTLNIYYTRWHRPSDNWFDYGNFKLTDLDNNTYSVNYQNVSGASLVSFSAEDFASLVNKYVLTFRNPGDNAVDFSHYNLNINQVDGYEWPFTFAPQQINWAIITPKYNWVGTLITLGLIASATALAVGLATYGTIKFVRWRRMKIAQFKAKASNAWNNFEADPTSLNYDAYRRAVRKNNLFSSIFGGNKLSYSDYWFDSGSSNAITTDDSSSLASAIPQLLQTNRAIADVEDAMQDIARDVTSLSEKIDDVYTLISGHTPPVNR